MTLTNGDSEIYQKGHRIEKSEDGAYTEELQVSVGDGKLEKVTFYLETMDDERFDRDVSSISNVTVYAVHKMK